MKYSSFPVVALLVTTLSSRAARSKEQCAPRRCTRQCAKLCRSALNPALPPIACREAEKEMPTQPSKDLPKATSGAADGLNYDSSKAAQKPAPKQSPQP